MDVKRVYIGLIVVVFVMLCLFIWHTHHIEENDGPYRPRVRNSFLPETNFDDVDDFQFDDEKTMNNSFGNVETPEISSRIASSSLYYRNLTNTAILILTYQRVHYLMETIESLLRLPHLEQFSLIISQDGPNDKILTALNKHSDFFKKKFNNFIHIINERDPKLYKASQHIAKHYKFALDSAFKTYKFDNVIILEEDMVFSHDFLYLFDQTVYLFQDPTIWCVSTWNDFGFKHLVSNSRRLFRTQYFPGLGWMTTRTIWLELSLKFPDDMWDDGMRGELGKHRDCIVPEISRNRNIGAEGANMNVHTFKTKLEHVAFYLGNQTDFGNVDYLLSENYERDLYQQFAKAEYIGSDVKDLIKRSLSPEKIYLLTFKSDSLAYCLRSLMIDFGEFRTHHNQQTAITYNGATVLLAHQKLCPYLPKSIKIDPRPNVLPYSAPLGYTCDKTCAVLQKTCFEDQFDFINNCETLYQFFPCKRCRIQYGDDIPNYVEDPRNQHDGSCLRTLAYVPRCGAAHKSVKRLCPCG